MHLLALNSSCRVTKRLCNILMYVPLSSDNNRLLPPDFIDCMKLSHNWPHLLLWTTSWHESSYPHFVKNQSLWELTWFVPSCSEVYYFSISPTWPHTVAYFVLTGATRGRPARRFLLGFTSNKFDLSWASVRGEPPILSGLCLFPFGTRHGVGLWKRLAWHQKTGGSLKTCCLPEMHEGQTRTWLNYMCVPIHTHMERYIYHKICVKTCLSISIYTVKI